VPDSREERSEYTEGAPQLGCGRLSRDQLELAALSRSDRDVPVDERTIAHLVICRECVSAVDRLHSEHTLLQEVATASRGPGIPLKDRASSESDDGPIAGYRLGRELHRGGQGAVFEAEQLATRRRCAVKMLLGGQFASAAQRARFEREVEVVAALRHPAIVTLYESGISRRGEPWFAMEFVEGERLDEHLRRTGAGPREIVDIMRRVSDAVAYAHRRGVIHRDLKPGNILIDREGAPRLLDFGLARATQAADAHDPRSSSTLAGEFVGTFAYAAPEQLAGEPAAIDSRCDLYALGVVFYEALAGKRPFDGAKSIGELVLQKTNQTPRRPSDVALGQGERIDRDLDVIVLRLLSPDPSRRYASAAALEEDLARHLDGRPILAREDSVTYVFAKTVRRHWIASSAALVFGLTVIGAGIALAVLYARAEDRLAAANRAQERFKMALTAADPELGEGSSEMNVREYLKVVEREVRSGLDAEPIEVGDLLLTLGVIQLGFQDSESAGNSIRTAHRVLEEGFALGKLDDVRMAAADVALARLQFLEADFTAAEKTYRRALELHLKTSGAFSVEAVNTERELASALRELGRFEDARACLERAYESSRRLPEGSESSIARAGIRNGRAILAARMGDEERALEDFRAALTELVRSVRRDDYRVGRTLYSIASSEFKLGRLDEAALHAEEALAILRLRKGDAARWTKDAALLAAKVEAAKSSRDQADDTPSR
jgi:eukaryotic-like serine/threonine-protein kinase